MRAPLSRRLPSPLAVSRRGLRWAANAPPPPSDRPMPAERVSLLDGAPTDRLCERAATHLRAGRVVALPTDTVYGLAALAQHDHAVAQLYDIKRRSELKPIAICVSQPEEVYKWARVTTPETLLRALLPGPVTLVFERTPALNPHLNPQTSLVGVRIPDHAFLRRLVADCGGPLALTSANASGDPSALRVEEFSQLHERLACVVDGGRLSEGPLARLGSTVVDLSVPGTFRIVRAGSAEPATRHVLQRVHGWTERVTH